MSAADLHAVGYVARRASAATKGLDFAKLLQLDAGRRERKGHAAHDDRFALDRPVEHGVGRE